MKVIDLLNKIANDEELPEKIKVMGATYYLCENDLSGSCYFSEKRGFGGVKLSFDTSVMNEEVEIIEEDNKIRKISPYVLCDSDFTKKGNYSTKATEIIDDAFEEMCNKINEIIEVINNEYNK